MGLAPMQRDQLSTEKQVFAALVPVPFSRRANRVGDGPREKGDRHRDVNFFSRFLACNSTEPVPFSR